MIVALICAWIAIMVLAVFVAHLMQGMRSISANAKDLASIAGDHQRSIDLIGKHIPMLNSPARVAEIFREEDALREIAKKGVRS